jgi:antitoxin component YwqK of YwqJK toxin-antitoxin module
MKKIVFLFTILLIISCSEKEVKLKSLVERNGLAYAINDDEPYSGIAFDKFSNEQFRIKGKYKDGKKTGEWIEYYENGQVKKKENFENGNYNGVFEKYNNQGSPLLLTNYKKGNFDGNYKEFEDGDLSLECNYKEGSLNGNYKRYSNGILLLDCNYKNGNYNGTYKTYNKNGVTTIETSYKDGSIDGKYIERFDNGNNKLEYSMNEGNYIDDYLYYNIDGTVKKHEFYKNDGTKINKGKWTIYYDEKWDEVSNPDEYYRIINFTNEGKESLVKDFYNNGKVQMEGEYSSIDPDIENGVFKWYSKKGELTMKGHFVNGKRDGVWETYYKTDNYAGTKIKEIATFKDNILNGKYIKWKGGIDFDNSNTFVSFSPQANHWKYEGFLKNGKLDGIFKVWIIYTTNTTASFDYKPSCRYRMDFYTTCKFNNGYQAMITDGGNSSYNLGQRNIVYDNNNKLVGHIKFSEYISNKNKISCRDK